MSGYLRPPVLIGGAVIAALAAGGWTLWRARTVLDQSASQMREASQIRFQDRRLDRAATPGVERLPSAASFRDAAWFQGALWIAAPDALFEYKPGSGLTARFRAGVELPPAPLTRVVVAPVDGRQQLVAATQGEGWLVFDGESLRQVRPEAAEHRKVTALLPVSTGELLIGTEKAGVLAWSGSALRPVHAGLAVTALAGSFDDLWIGTLDHGVAHARGGQLDRFERELPDVRVLSLAVNDQTAYAGTALGIAEFRGGRWHRNFGDGEFAKALHHDGKRLHVGTMEDEVEAIRDAEGRVVTVARGEIRVGGKREIAAERALLTDGNIAALAVDPAGRTWIGYFDRGLDLIDPSFAPITHIEDEHVFCVNRIVPARDGAVIATANGLVLADAAGKPRQVLGRKDGLIANHVTDVIVEPTGMIAATPAGVTFLAPSNTESIYAFHGLVNNHVYSLGFDRGKLLAGTLGGVSLIEDRIVRTSYTTANSALRHNWISALAKVGDAWFAGTYGAGVYRFDGSRWEPFSDLREGFEVNPNAMLATDAAVYAGTLGRGIAVYNRASGRWSFQTAGLPSTNVTALAAHGGRIWVGTDNGLVRMEERSLAR